MSANGSNRFLNIEDANLRVRSGNVHAKGITVGGITVGAAHGLQSVSNVSNTTSNTLQFTNATTAFKATSNIEIGGDVSYTSKPKISVESNVVAEYTGPHDRPLREYPEVAMTQNDESATSGYVVSQGGVNYSGLEPWELFDKSYTSSLTSWAPRTSDGTPNYTVVEGSYNRYNTTLGTATRLSGDTEYGEYVKLELPDKIRLNYIVIRPHPGSTDYATKFPAFSNVYGSNDDVKWTEITNWTPNDFILPVNDSDEKRFIANATKSYKYLALVVTGVGGTTHNETVFNGLEYYGHEEGSGSLDTTLKSVYNVPATTGTQLEVYYDAKDYTQASDFTGTGGVVDKVGGDQDGTVNGTIGFDSTYKAFTFNGNASNYINAGAVGLTDDAVHTVSLWFKYTGNGTHQAIFSISSNGADETTNNATNFLIRSDGTMWFVHWSNEAKTTDVFIEDQWYHVTYTYEGGGATLAKRGVYINGKRIYKTLEQGTDFGDELTLTSPQMIIGKRYFASAQLPFNGSIANFRLYSKALNAGQVKELYDYQKDYFLGSKSQVTLYKGHLGVGVTEPSGQLELAGDERIQEYPPRGMTKNETLVEGHGVFSALGGIGGETYAPWKAFDKSTSTFWIDVGIRYSDVTPFGALSTASKTTLYDGSVLSGGWIDLECPYPVKLKRVGTAPRTNYSSIGLQRGIILGSNNGVDWYQIDTIDYAGTTPPNTLTYFDITTETYYSHLRLVCTNLTARYPASGTSDMHWQMGELVYFGTPGPTTLDKGSLSLTRSLDVPRVSRYDVDTETPRPEKLVLDFDTTVNSSPTDISGKGNHMTFHGNARYSEADKAFVFDGTTGTYMSGTQNLGTGTPAHTITGWFKRTSTLTEYTWIFTIGTSATGQMSGLLIDPQGDIVFDIFNHRIETQKRINNNEWYHFAGVFHGASSTWSVDTCDVYINGVLEPTQSTGTSPQTFNLTGNQIYFGTSTNFLRYSSCLISNFKLYNVALEPSEVRKLYNLGRTGRSMVISDTAVGIGKVPEAQLDVRGIGQFGSIYAPGTVIQVQHNSGDSLLSYSSSANASSGSIPLSSATGLKLSISPTKTTSKVHVNLNVLAYFTINNSSSNGVRMQVWRKIGTTYTRVYGRGGSTHDLHWYKGGITGNPHVFLNISFVDSPNTVLACEYELRAMLYATPPSGGYLYMGNGGNQPATITLMEIGGE